MNICPESIGRATRILQALLTAFAQRGYKVTVSEKFPRRTTIHLLGEEVAFVLEEAATQVPHKPGYDKENDRYASFMSRPPKHSYLSTGRLRLRIPDVPGGPYQGWSYGGGAKRPLESMLNEFVQGLIRITVLIKRDREEREIRRKREEEERRRREEAQRLQRIEDARMKLLDSQISDWRQSRSIREYVEAVRAEVIARTGELDPESPAAKWIEWALRKADRLDPIKRGNPWEEPYEVRYW